MALKLIGAGFGRTGTMSLKAALEQLGLNPCYHMVECFPKGPQHWDLWTQAANGSPDWDAIFDGFEATVDFPACTSYRALAEYYPDAKVVLSVRDPEAWYRSTQETIFSKPWIDWLANSEAAPYMSGTINDYFDNRMHDRDHLIARFNEHIDEVKATIAPGRLLVFEAKQGWEPLCNFLELPVPDGDFPHINDNEATKAIIQNIMENGFDKVFGF
jgi:hypothetical protein